MKNVGILVVILLVLGGIAYFVVNSSDSTVDSDLTKDFFAVDSASITKIEMNSVANGDVILSKESGTWMLTKPVNYKADTSRVYSLLKEAKSIKVINPEVSSNPTKHAKFNVDDSLGTSVKLYSANGLAAEYVIGKRTNGGIFIRQPNSDVTILTSTFNSFAFAQKAEQFRDKVICKLESESITGYEVTSPIGKITVEKADSLWFVSGERKKEKRTEANGNFINTWNTRFGNFYTSKFKDETSGADFSKPEILIKVTTTSGEKSVAAVLDLEDKNFFQVKYSDSEQIFLVSKGVIDSFAKPYEDLKKIEEKK
ncbi:MAG: DUF4340 domain-containing protein [Calditrichaeota bacterium]|nr:MAG: DUF4340 domain-containing protein [Calditrichota bacterium]